MPTSTAHGPEITHIMSHVLLFFGVAGLLVPLLQRIRLSPVIAYLLCGIAIGPFGLARLSMNNEWLKYFSISDTSTVSLFGEFGIIALMFMIGLELSFRRLKELRKFVFGLGGTQIVFSGSMIFVIGFVLGNSKHASILIGASLALSSTAIVMQLLEEKRLTNQNVGILCFSILLMQDLCVVPILVLAGSFVVGAGNETLYLLVRSIVVAVCTVVLIYVIGRWLLRPVLNIVSGARNPEWLSSFMLLIVMGCASITIFAGLSGALGAFLAGLLIAETEFRYEVEVIISPLKSLLLGVFFMSIGMMIDMLEIVKNPLLLLGWVIGLFIIKAGTIFIAGRLFNVSRGVAAQTAIYLAQPGEFAFMVISVALAANIILPAQAQFFLLVTALSMLFTPLLFEIAPFLTRRLSSPNEALKVGKHPEKMVIIAGFGRIGQILGTILQEQRVPYIAIDHDAEKVRSLQERGFRVVYGDAKNINLWNLIHAESAVAAVVTVDEQHAAKSILKSIQGKWPLLPVVLRANDIKDVDPLHDLGAKYVVPETLESSLRMARLLMVELGIDQETIEGAIEQTWTRSCSLSVSY